MEASIEDKNCNSGIVGPLNFSDQSSKSVQLSPTIEVPCLFCCETFQFYSEKHEYLAHLYLNHRLIIGDEDKIAIFHEYLIQWRRVFKGHEQRISEFCTTMVMDQLPDGQPSKNEKYYLLCDVSPQDYELRQTLQKRRLELALAQHQFERTDDKFERSCLFCREVVKSTRCDFVEHLFGKHFLQLGKPENLVFVDELIDTVQGKLAELICIFCEKTFKDRPTLKEHMRKKGHKRINPDNKSYDRFFLINYQNQQSKTYKKSLPKKSHKESNNASFEQDSSDSNWSDWEGDEQIVTCLFCTHKNNDFQKVKDHIKLKHEIDFDKDTQKMTFYDRVKIVNFVRRAMYKMQCIKCKAFFQNMDDLQAHLKENSHYSLGETNEWNLPQYFFPTYEDDAFLQHLDNSNFDDDSWAADSTGDSPIVVYAEEKAIEINLDAEALSMEQMKIL